MIERPLNEVLADVIDACHRYPELRRHILDCLFDSEGLREGLFNVETADSEHAADGRTLTLMMRALLPTPWLKQFAHAVAQGVLPEMVLPVAEPKVRSSAGHESSRSREGSGLKVSGGSFMRIPEYLNTE
jgi:hypothetical protein